MDYKDKVERNNRYNFSISFNGTDENVDTHTRFKKFCEAYDNVYISGLRALLDDYDMRREYECILGLVDDMEQRVALIEAQLTTLSEELETKEEKKVMKTFGKKE